LKEHGWVPNSSFLALKKRGFKPNSILGIERARLQAAPNKTPIDLRL